MIRTTLLDRVTERLTDASHGDRMYEKPMCWSDADAIVSALNEMKNILTQPNTSSDDAVYECLNVLVERLN